MAGIAGRRGLVTIQPPSVTALTARCPVPTDERVLRVVIVVEDHCFPILFVVTLVAFVAKICLVNVVLLVARVAIRRCLVFV